MGKRKGLPVAEKASLLDRQIRLQSRIDAFNQKSQVVLPHRNWDELLATSTEGIDAGQVTEVEDDQEEEEEDLEVQSVDPASMSMPSAFGQEACRRNGWLTVATQEKELRVGQANECLTMLRLALGHKSLLLRQSVRIAQGQKARTRAWDEVTSIEEKIKKEVAIYHRAREALVQLGAEEDILKQYQPIGPEDLKMPGDVVEENRFGQRSDALAWFWRMDGAGHYPGNNWMNECESFFQALIQFICKLKTTHSNKSL
jgi:hypothetical protein